RDPRHGAQSRARARRRARPSPRGGAREDRREVHPRQSERVARGDRRPPLRDHWGPAAARADPVLGRLGRRPRDGGGRAHRRATAPGAPHRGADGEEAHVLQPREGGARARPAADRYPRGAPRRDRMVPRARRREGPMITDLTARLTRKSRSNFYYAFLTLPRPRREALYAVYAFCRTVDDIADLGGERGAAPSAQRRELQRWREYVPQADLLAFGVTVDDLKAERYTDRFVRLMAHQAARARRFYRFAWESFPPADARPLVPAEIMGRIYLALLDEIEARRFRVF